MALLVHPLDLNFSYTAPAVFNEKIYVVNVVIASVGTSFQGKNINGDNLSCSLIVLNGWEFGLFVHLHLDTFCFRNFKLFLS